MAQTITLGFDASCVLAPRSGVGRFTAELLRALADEASEDFRLAVLLNSLRHPVPPEIRAISESPFVRLVRRRIPGPLLVHAWAKRGLPSLEHLLGQQITVAYAPAGYIPPTRVPVVATIHDAAFLREDRATDAALGSGFFRRHWPTQLPRCAMVATDSRFVAEDIRPLCGTAPIRAIPAGISTCFLQQDFRPRSGCFLAVTSDVPRKRNNMLLAAFREYRRRGGTADLRVAGWDGGGASFPSVQFLPRLSDGELALAYAEATATVLTTREEGFGFPLLESFACGTPVIASRHSSLSEIGGELATWVQEDHTAGFADAMASVEATAPSHAQKAALRAHAAQYSWKETARQYRALFQSLC